MQEVFGFVKKNLSGSAAKEERQDSPIAGHSYVIGADWGRSFDFTVFCVIDTTTHTMVDMDRSRGVDYVVQRGRLMALYEKWKPSKIIAEQNSIGQPIIEQLQRDGLPVTPFVTTNASKALIVESLALAFERGDIAILNDVVLLSELQSFQGEQLPGGIIRYSAPSSGHDDCVMSLALAWSVLRVSFPWAGTLEFNRREVEAARNAPPVPQLIETPRPLAHDPAYIRRILRGGW